MVHVHVAAEDGVQTPEGRILCRDVRDVNSCAVDKLDQIRPPADDEAAVPLVRPPPVALPVNRPGAGDGDVVCAVGVDESLVLQVGPVPGVSVRL